MASTSDIAKRYFEALGAHDLDAAVACWTPGGIDRLVGQEDLVAPEGVRQYFGELFEAFPDFSFEILDTTTYRNRSAVRWRARGTFAGPGTLSGIHPQRGPGRFGGLRRGDGRRRQDQAQRRLRRLRRDRSPAGLPSAGRLTRAKRGSRRWRIFVPGSCPGSTAKGPSRSPTEYGSCAAASRSRR